ncbi:hypothetical protein [Streptomyces hypolithicus]
MTRIRWVPPGAAGPGRHPSLSGRIDGPDRLVFDLDPHGDALPAVRGAVCRLGAFLRVLRSPAAGARGAGVRFLTLLRR